MRQLFGTTRSMKLPLYPRPPAVISTRRWGSGFGLRVSAVNYVTTTQETDYPKPRQRRRHRGVEQRDFCYSDVLLDKDA